MSTVVGVDVGGTYTDAVVLKGRTVLSSCKFQTTANRTDGIVNAIKGAFDKYSPKEGEISRVCIGTTHFVNAVIERSANKLSKVAVVRLCGPASRALPPFADFPNELKILMKASVHMVSGGIEYNRVPISPICNDDIHKLANDLLNQSVTNVVISGVFSPNAKPGSNQEEQVAEIFQNVSDQFSITLASKIGKLGIIERENASILNESLKKFAKRTVSEFKTALDALNLSCPFYLTQNDGTLISVDEAVQYPVFTFSSGPTNSMRGAMFLSGKEDGIVVDIGGTTTDVGVLVKGFPREASSQVKIGGVSTNFRMPNVISIGLGGGSIITACSNKENEEKVCVGPNSVGSMLTSKGLCFGGDICTASDIAVGAGVTKVLPLDHKGTILSKYGSIIYQAMRNIHHMIEEAIDLVKTTDKDALVLLVGGGSVLVDTAVPLTGASRVIIPLHFEVANAVGAALGMISGQAESIESLSATMAAIKEGGASLNDEEIRQEAQRLIVDRTIDKAMKIIRSKGCIPGTEYVHEKSVMNLTYVPDTLSVWVKVIGLLTDETREMGSNDNKEVPMTSDEPAVQDSDSTVWPYKSKHEVTLDEEAMLSPPIIDSRTSEWILSELDVECITIGAGILGCGGGGSPQMGYLTAIQTLREGKEIRILNPVKARQEECGMLAVPALMGAPLILIEKLESGNETTNCIEVMQKILASGLCTQDYDYGRLEKDGIILSKKSLDNGHDSWFVDPSTLPHASIGDTNIPLDKRITGLISAEVGGANSIEPLLVGARLGLPVLDADGMGRAFPELQMFVPFINGLPPYPSCVANEKGDKVAVSHITTPKELEDVFRMECVRMGMSCGICLSITLQQVLDWGILYSYSRAWRLGRCIKRAIQKHSNVVDAIVEQENGLLLITGKITDVIRQTEGGFTDNLLIVKGTGLYSPFMVQVNAKNENLIAREICVCNENGDKKLGQVLAVTPDLITLVDTDTGYPITTENVKYGLRVSVLVLPADSKLLTKEALKVVGPQGFGMTDIDYCKPVSLL